MFLEFAGLHYDRSAREFLKQALSGQSLQHWLRQWFQNRESAQQLWRDHSVAILAPERVHELMIWIMEIGSGNGLLGPNKTTNSLLVS